MIAPGMGLRILVATQPVDFRRGMDSRSAGERSATCRPILRRAVRLSIETSGSNQKSWLGRNRPVSVFEAFGKRALYMAADPRRIDHAERRAIVVAHRRFGLAPPARPCCENTIASGLNTDKHMAFLEARVTLLLWSFETIRHLMCDF